MNRFLIVNEDAPADAPCALCGGSLPVAGPRLAREGDLAPVCLPCGRKHAPALAALVDLGDRAERLGRVSQHAPLGLSLEDMLDLARAAESYFRSAARKSA